MKKYLLALEDGYMDSGELVYKKGKKYPVTGEEGGGVYITDEEGDSHWFETISDDNSYKIIPVDKNVYFKTKFHQKGVYEYLKGEEVVISPCNRFRYSYTKKEFNEFISTSKWFLCNKDGSPIKTKNSVKRPTDNWKKTISRSKWLRCVVDENCVVIENMKDVYYNPVTGFIYRIIKNCNNEKTYVSINLRKVGMIKDKGVAEYYNDLIIEYYEEEMKIAAMNSCHSKEGDRELFEELKESLEECVEIKKERGSGWSDKHYDNYYILTEDDIEAGKIRLDAYTVNRAWKINAWDDTGAAFHLLKTLPRIANEKNDLERELTALYKQVKCLCKLHNVKAD